ncbi:hypothetical protein PENSTE_c005G06940 [Penicillium steckii]|uniref:Uncharacterized protein n=1 Tax=Penicillium steckii TaxID=303698 RepID=A0A1V6TIY8_9EURO|nr:hypothetical protein PENSTE_c005G06940 [Penicillium steckii]
MDFASLTRPAIICHCRRCFSSLAVLENEWAEVSNFYATSTAWVSVDADRISVSSQRKRIPDHSDASLIRGRITQEASCRMCPTSSKLGVLVEMDNGPIFIWKMSKVSFREVVSMRPTEPVFKEGAIEKLLAPPPKETLRTGSFQGDALVPAGATDFRSMDPVMQHHMQHQGRSIDQISSSVNNLHDTMSDLKNSFTSLRIELNGPNRYSGDSNGPSFDMVATVLKELKSKSDEIEKLKLEIEALKLKARIAEDSKPHTPDYMAGLEGALPRMQSPDLLQAGRKRGWADTFSGGNSLAITDTFHEDDMEDALSITGQMPLSGPQVPLSELAQSQSESRQWHSETVPQSANIVSNNRETQPPHPAQSPAKRQRLAQYQSNESAAPDKKKIPRGRPRKSDSQEITSLSQSQSGPGDSGKRDAPPKKNNQRSSLNNKKPNRGNGRSRRSLAQDSRGPAESGIDNDTNLPRQDPIQIPRYGDEVIPDSSQLTIEHMDETNNTEVAPADGKNTFQLPVQLENGSELQLNGVSNDQNVPPISNGAINGTHINEEGAAGTIKPSDETSTNHIGVSGASQDSRGGGGGGRRKRKASLAARDAMIRNEMQREEQMASEQV